MADRPKLIAVCLSQIHNTLNTGFLTELSSVFSDCGYGVTVFNSSMDFYWYNKDNQIPRAGFRTIHYDLFDAIFIICHSFHDDDLVREIAEGAKAHNVPVILLGMELPGCYSVINDIEAGYKGLLRHVIRDHGAKDTFFIAGMKDEPNSESRLKCYREVLEECGLPFRSSQVAYGNYWAKPAADITRKLIRSREKLPDAIFCANDVMAISVCDTLREEGFRVPQDVMVTGFDGMPASYMVQPRLATCCDNPRALAEQSMELILKLKSGEHPPYEIIHSFRAIYSESCGCPGIKSDIYDALSVYRRSEAMNSHENDLYHTVGRLLVQKDPEAFLKMISASILPDSYICLNKRFLGIYSGVDYYADRLEEDLLFIPYRDKEEDFSIQECRLSDLKPQEGLETGLTVFNTLHTGTVVCGFYAAHTTDLYRDAQLIKRLSDVLNLIFTIHLGNARQQLLIHHLDSTLYTDSVTGLNNLKGLTRWFEDYSAVEENHLRPLALSVYSIYRYSYIYETYGMNETEEIVRLVANRLTSSNPNALIIARISEDQFVVMDSGENAAVIGRTINRSTADFFSQIESYNSISTRQYYVEVNCGCTTVDSGWKGTAMENLIRLALGELYLNRLRSSSRAVSKTSSSTSELYSAFNLLMEKNLFKFHFQPIVSARNGQIFAYEALMRTDNLINLSPIEVLAIAREYNRLYDVERATLFGIMDRFVQNYSGFFGNKVFINTIPGHFLSDEDCAALREQFDSYLDCFVFELTEQDTTTEEELYRLKSLCKTGSSAQIAIDDFGTGHSNIVNVLRYTPQIIKIDRELISGIQNDQNKQLFVRNTIEFAHQNGIKALAEGVETSDELRAVIDYGIDLIQGYYTGRPSEQPAPAINETVRHEILAENLMLTRFNRDTKVYSAKDGDSLDLLNLAMEHYTCIQVSGGHITLTGQKSQSVDMLIRITEDTESFLTLKNVNLKGVNETSIQLGNRAHLTLTVEGSNTLNKDGIRVPASSHLVLQGRGDLKILNNRNYSCGIGSNYNDPYGTIVIDLEGMLTIQSSGDKVVCIGGGRSAGEGIFLLRGSLHLSANGISVIGLGSSTGDAQIRIDRASVSALIEGNDALGIGSLSAHAIIRSAGTLEITVNCERATGIGSMTGTGEIRIEGGSISVTIHCDAGACIGTFSGEVSSHIANARVHVHGEGNRVAALGSTDGASDMRIESGDVEGNVLAGERMLLGNEHSRVIITGGNVRIFPENNQTPFSPAGLPLYCQTPPGDHFEQVCQDKRATWTYMADRAPDGQLFVWLPR
jgi:EAL domain-containing protein (putative c-di-GMP-specific phosphodiesterase class I)/DNA-binding LacI/PurR family transcriptional regulator/GGDEF domain-containing protein